VRDETEFTYGGDATVRRPDMSESDPKLWLDYAFMRGNPRGPHTEFWHHVTACRQWIVVTRNTLTHQFGATRLAREEVL
jgi:sarcosine oxidase subunit delta